MNNDMVFSQNIKYLRKKHGMTQEDLGKLLGMVRSGIANWEKGITAPTYKRLGEIAKIFNIDPKDLMDPMKRGTDASNIHTFGRNVAFLRKKAGLTQAELATKLKVSCPIITHWETGYAETTVTTLRKIAQFFGVGAMQLLDEPLYTQEPKMGESGTYVNMSKACDIIKCNESQIYALVNSNVVRARGRGDTFEVRADDLYEWMRTRKSWSDNKKQTEDAQATKTTRLMRAQKAPEAITQNGRVFYHIGRVSRFVGRSSTVILRWLEKGKHESYELPDPTVPDSRLFRYIDDAGLKYIQEMSAKSQRYTTTKKPRKNKKNIPVEERDYFSRKEAAAILNVTEQRVSYLKFNGVIKGSGSGRYDKESVLKERDRHNSASQPTEEKSEDADLTAAIREYKQAMQAGLPPAPGSSIDTNVDYMVKKMIGAKFDPTFFNQHQLTLPFVLKVYRKKYNMTSEELAMKLTSALIIHYAPTIMHTECYIHTRDIDQWEGGQTSPYRAQIPALRIVMGGDVNWWINKMQYPAGPLKWLLTQHPVEEDTPPKETEQQALPEVPEFPTIKPYKSGVQEGRNTDKDLLQQILNEPNDKVKMAALKLLERMK